MTYERHSASKRFELFLKQIPVWFGDHHDWLRQHRRGARLQGSAERYVREFRGWPRVYAGKDGAFHIIAPHQEPHMPIGLALAGACIAGVAWAAWWLWHAVHPAAGIVLAVAALPVLPLLLRLTERHLEIIIKPDGHIVRRGAGGREYLLLDDYRQKHDVFAGPHGSMKGEAAAREAWQRHHADMRGWMQQQGGPQQQGQQRPGLPPIMPGQPRYAEATEVFFQFGANKASTERIAEFRMDRDGKALKLKAAIEVVTEASRQEGRHRSSAALRDQA